MELVAESMFVSWAIRNSYHFTELDPEQVCKIEYTYSPRNELFGFWKNLHYVKRALVETDSYVPYVSTC